MIHNQDLLLTDICLLQGTHMQMYGKLNIQPKAEVLASFMDIDFHNFLSYPTMFLHVCFLVVYNRVTYWLWQRDQFFLTCMEISNVQLMQLSHFFSVSSFVLCLIYGVDEDKIPLMLVNNAR